MDDLEWFFVRPNALQPLHVKIQRLRLGSEAYDTYRFASQGSGYFALWIPTGCGGRLAVEMRKGESGTLSLWRDGAPLDKVNGSRIEHQIPMGTMGRIDVHVTPFDRPVRASFIAEAWPEDAGKPLIPWNFWFFPYCPDDSSPVPGRDYDSRAVQLSAVQKLDRAAPPLEGPPWAEKWERANHVSETAAGWEGHCDPAAFASCFFEQPEAKTLGGVAFTRDELELLASEWAGSRLNVDGGGWNLQVDGGGPAMQVGSGPRRTATYLLRPGEPIDADILHARYVQVLGKPQDRVPVQENLAIARAAVDVAAEPEKVRQAFARAALGLWRFLDARMLHGREPMVGDFGAFGVKATCPQVWNHAVVKLEVRFVERDADKPAPTAPSPLLVQVGVLIATNCDEEPLHPNDGGARVSDLPPATWDGSRLHLSSVACMAWEQTLDLDFNESGACLAARWRSSSVQGSEAAWAPRLFGIPGKPRLHTPPAGVTPPGNPAVTDGFVQRMLTLRKRFR
jgi:hypothetical protein